MTATKCHDCHRPINSREAQERGRGSQCWREHLAALGLRPAKVIGRGRRYWAVEMPGQELLDLEDAA